MSSLGVGKQIVQDVVLLRPLICLFVLHHVVVSLYRLIIEKLPLYGIIKRHQLLYITGVSVLFQSDRPGCDGSL